jgi:hypothetical protein
MNQFLFPSKTQEQARPDRVKASGRPGVWMQPKGAKKSELDLVHNPKSSEWLQPNEI